MDTLKGENLLQVTQADSFVQEQYLLRRDLRTSLRMLF